MRDDQLTCPFVVANVIPVRLFDALLIVSVRRQLSRAFDSSVLQVAYSHSLLITCQAALVQLNSAAH